MPDFTGINHIVLTVRNLEASLSWYERVLGLTKIPEAETDTFQLLALPNSQLTIGLRVHESTDDKPFAESTTGLDHISLQVSGRAQLEVWRARFEEMGVVHSPIADESYGSVVVFRDPDNIQLEMFSVPGT